MPDIPNDNDAYPAAAKVAEPDAHGQAAMLLVESLIFGLIEREAISVEDALDIVEAATEVKLDIAADIGESPETMRRSLSLLAAISDSLRLDTQSK